MAGLDETGLTIKRFPEIKSEILTEQRSRIDPNITDEDDTVFGQLNNILASANSDIWALSQAVNDNFNIEKAEGKNLDDLGALKGVPRQGESKTTGSQYFVASSSTTVPAGRVLENPATEERFFVLESVDVNTANSISSDWTVKDVQNNTSYQFTINNSIYEYVSDSDATASEIVTGLDALIQADTTKDWTSSVDGETLTIASDTFDLPISVISLANITADQITSVGTIEAEFSGDILAPPETVTNLVTPVSGVISTTNPQQLVRGRVEESDEDYRFRIRNSGSGSGKATALAIKTALGNVSGVSSVVIVENDQSVVDGDGRPPKSFESIVVGGSDQDIAQSIYDTKAAGIESHGSVSEFITDVNGDSYLVKFSRPQGKVIAIRVNYTLYSEEDFPPNGEALMTTAVVDHTNTLGSGIDVITGRMYAPLYASVEGIDTLTVETQELVNSGDTPVPANWSTSTIPISETEFATANSVDVFIIQN